TARENGPGIILARGGLLKSHHRVVAGWLDGGARSDRSETPLAVSDSRPAGIRRLGGQLHGGSRRLANQPVRVEPGQDRSTRKRQYYVDTKLTGERCPE